MHLILNNLQHDTTLDIESIRPVLSLFFLSILNVLSFLYQKYFTDCFIFKKQDLEVLIHWNM